MSKGSELNPDHNYDEEWCCQVELGIYDVKSLYAVICYALGIWPGSPARPVEEQEHLQKLRDDLYRCILDFKFREM